jgi:threonine/homoserine/homoserine lactone efflux protein
MKSSFLAYYASRAGLSIVFSLVVFGVTWTALVMATALFGLFVLYLRSGWFRVDPAQPLFPLRRDDRGKHIQRNALIAGILVGTATYLMLSLMSVSIPAASTAIAFAVVAYLGSQFLQFVRA